MELCLGQWRKPDRTTYVIESMTIDLHPLAVCQADFLKNQGVEGPYGLVHCLQFSAVEACRIGLIARVGDP